MNRKLKVPPQFFGKSLHLFRLSAGVAAHAERQADDYLFYVVVTHDAIKMQKVMAFVAAL